MPSFWPDLRLALRNLRKDRGFNALAILTLALGIGASTTIFSVVQGVLLDAYPYRDVDRIVNVQVRDLSRPEGTGRLFFQVPEFLDLQEQVQCLEEVIAGSPEDVLYTTGEGTELWGGAAVTVNNFSFLGLPAALGRTLEPGDEKPGAPPVFVMNHKLWVRRFGQDPSIVGGTYVLNGVPTTLVGIMPARFSKLGGELYRPAVLDRADPEGSRRYFMFQGRLKPGVTLEQAEAEVGAAAQRLAQVYPKNYPPKFAVRVVRLLDSTLGPFRKTIYILAAAVGLLLAIACGNVANMLLTRAAAREREMAVRASLGATRLRLIRQLLIESLLLSLLGAGLGALCAFFGVRALVAAMPPYLIPGEAVIRLNPVVLLFSLGVAVLTALLCGLVPALQTVRRDLVEPLKDGAKGSSAAFARRRFTRAVVVAEVASASCSSRAPGCSRAASSSSRRSSWGSIPRTSCTSACRCARRVLRPRGEGEAPGPGRRAAAVAARRRRRLGHEHRSSLRWDPLRHRDRRPDAYRPLDHDPPARGRRVLPRAAPRDRARAFARGGGGPGRAQGGGRQPGVRAALLRRRRSDRPAGRAEGARGRPGVAGARADLRHRGNRRRREEPGPAGPASSRGLRPLHGDRRVQPWRPDPDGGRPGQHAEHRPTRGVGGGPQHRALHARDAGAVDRHVLVRPPALQPRDPLASSPGWAWCW